MVVTNFLQIYLSTVRVPRLMEYLAGKQFWYTVIICLHFFQIFLLKSQIYVSYGKTI